jgi:plastocyanin
MKRNTNIRWLLLLGVIFFALVLAACTGNSQPQNHESHAQANGKDATINVTAEDLSFSLDGSQLKAGTITFIIRNNGFMTHDFAIRGNGIDQQTPMINPGESATLTVDLHPGTYTYECTMPGHAQAGMTGTFTVSSN